jgi:hypothetical protein
MKPCVEERGGGHAPEDQVHLIRAVERLWRIRADASHDWAVKLLDILSLCCAVFRAKALIYREFSSTLFLNLLRRILSFTAAGSLDMHSRVWNDCKSSALRLFHNILINSDDVSAVGLFSWLPVDGSALRSLHSVSGVSLCSLILFENSYTVKLVAAECIGAIFKRKEVKSWMLGLKSVHRRASQANSVSLDVRHSIMATLSGILSFLMKEKHNNAVFVRSLTSFFSCVASEVMNVASDELSLLVSFSLSRCFESSSVPVLIESLNAFSSFFVSFSVSPLYIWTLLTSEQTKCVFALASRLFYGAHVDHLFKVCDGYSTVHSFLSLFQKLLSIDNDSLLEAQCNTLLILLKSLGQSSDMSWITVHQLCFDVLKNANDNRTLVILSFFEQWFLFLYKASVGEGKEVNQQSCYPASDVDRFHHHMISILNGCKYSPHYRIFLSRICSILSCFPPVVHSTFSQINLEAIQRLCLEELNQDDPVPSVFSLTGKLVLSLHNANESSLAGSCFRSLIHVLDSNRIRGQALIKLWSVLGTLLKELTLISLEPSILKDLCKHFASSLAVSSKIFPYCLRAMGQFLLSQDQSVILVVLSSVSFHGWLQRLVILLCEGDNADNGQMKLTWNACFAASGFLKVSILFGDGRNKQLLEQLTSSLCFIVNHSSHFKIRLNAIIALGKAPCLSCYGSRPLNVMECLVATLAVLNKSQNPTKYSEEIWNHLIWGIWHQVQLVHDSLSNGVLRSNEIEMLSSSLGPKSLLTLRSCLLICLTRKSTESQKSSISAKAIEGVRLELLDIFIRVGTHDHLEAKQIIHL